MEITEVRVIIPRNNNGNKLKAYANIVFDDCFIVRSLKIIEGKDGFFVAMPSVGKGDTIKDIAHPINNDFRKIIENKVLDAYEDKLNEEIHTGP